MSVDLLDGCVKVSPETKKILGEEVIYELEKIYPSFKEMFDGPRIPIAWMVITELATQLIIHCERYAAGELLRENIYKDFCASIEYHLEQIEAKND